MIEQKLASEQASRSQDGLGDGDQRLLALLFQPVPKPLAFVPAALRNANIIAELPKVEPPVISQRLPKLDPGERVLTHPASRNLLDVCTIFASLVNSPVWSTDSETRESPVLTRPAMSCMLLALLPRAADGDLIYSRALSYFDSEARPITVQGVSLASGTLRGLFLDQDHDDFGALITMFENIVVDTMDGSDLKALRKAQMVFDTQLDAAKVMALRRLRYLEEQVARGKGISSHIPRDRWRPLPKPHGPPENTGAAAHPAQDRDNESAESSSVAGARSATINENSVEDTGSVGQPTTGRSTNETSEASEPSLDTLYAQTFTIAKGELLSLMLVEPEVLHLVWMYYGLFQLIFAEYSDVPTDFLGNPMTRGGHMSRSAFMQFCMDFGLFPMAVDYNTLQFVYHGAESTVVMEGKEIKSRMRVDPNKCPFKVGQTVELAPGANKAMQIGDVTISSGEPVQIIDVCFDSGAKACRVLTASKKKLWVEMGALMHTMQDFQLEKGGKETTEDQVMHKWIHKGFDKMTNGEIRAVTVLSAFDDRIADLRARSRDLFAQFDIPGAGIHLQSFSQALRMVQLEAPPTQEEVKEIFSIIDADGSGGVDYEELDSVLMAIRERKARHKRGGNLFLKDPQEMSSAESSVDKFFVTLTRALRARGMTTQDVFREFDRDNSGQLGAEELIEVAQTLGLETPDRSTFERGIMMVDQNMAGALGVKDFNRCMGHAKEAIGVREREARNARNPFVEVAERSAGNSVQIFGLKAFIECLLKIGIAYLSFHGTAGQSELPAHTKVTWLLTFLSWQFEQARVKSSIVNKMAADAAITQGAGGEMEQPSQVIREPSVAMWRNAHRGASESNDNEPASNIATVRRQRFSTWMSSHTHLKKKRSLREEIEQVADIPSSAVPIVAEELSTSGSDQDKETTGSQARSKLKSCFSNVLKKKDYVAGLPPLKRMLTRRPNLFHLEPQEPPRHGSSTFAREGPCPTCGCLPYKGWGTPACRTCGLGDFIVEACMKGGDQLEEIPALHRIVCATHRWMEGWFDDESAEMANPCHASPRQE